MKKLFLLTFFITGMFLKGTGQPNKNVYFDHKGADIVSYLQKRLNYPASLYRSCTMPFTYVKFKIRSSGDVDSLTLSDEHPDIRTELIKYLSLAKGSWRVDKVSNRWIIIPLMFIKTNTPSKDCDLEKEIAVFVQKIDHRYPESKDNIYFPNVVISAGGGSITKY